MATSPSSTRASANLFLSLVPLAKRHPYLLHAICAWSAANLAAASSASRSGPAAASTSSNPVMAHLSEQLGLLADSGLGEALPALEAYASARTERLEELPGEAMPPWEAMLAARLMQTQAAICSGSTELWRVRMRDAAKVVELAGGVRACRTPLARQLLKNLLYHDVLSSSSTREGLLVDYASLAKPSSASAGAASVDGTPGDDERARQDAEDDEEEALDTLMGVSEPVFHLLGTIAQLAKEKRQGTARDGGALGEDELAAFLGRVDDIKRMLEREKERMDGFLLGASLSPPACAPLLFAADATSTNRTTRPRAAPLLSRNVSPRRPRLVRDDPRAAASSSACPSPRPQDAQLGASSLFLDCRRRELC